MGLWPRTARSVTGGVRVRSRSWRRSAWGRRRLRGPTKIQAAEVPPAGRENDPGPSSDIATASNARPLDLSWLPPKSAGFIAFKPAAIAAIPACKPQLVKLNDLIRDELGAGMPRIESIEQAAFEVSILPRDRSKKRLGRIMTGAWMMRTVEEFDWKPAIKAFFKKLEKSDLDLVEVRLGGHVYYKRLKSPYPRPFGPDAFYLPDRRTIVWDYEDNLRRMISQTTRTGPDFVKVDDWPKVGSGLIAAAMDTRDNRWKLDVETDEPEDLPFVHLLQQPTRWVLGIDGTDALVLQAIASCDSESKRNVVARNVDTLLGQGRIALGKRNTSDPKFDPADFESGAMRLAAEFVRASVVGRDGLAVEIRATSTVNVDSLLAFVIAAVFG